jgi:hypothetical protein
MEDRGWPDRDAGYKIQDEALVVITHADEAVFSVCLALTSMGDKQFAEKYLIRRTDFKRNYPILSEIKRIYGLF